MSIDRIKVGLISDTHGLLRPEALEALRGCDTILHAGDVGAGVLEKLKRTFHTVVAVRGNTDWGPWGQTLRWTEQVDVSGLKFYIVHDLSRSPAVPEGVHVVVHGHTHRWSSAQEGGLWYINPGSIGPRRFDLPITLGIAVVEGPNIQLKRITIEA